MSAELNFESILEHFYVEGKAILIGGGISAQGESLTEPLQKRVDKLMLGHGRYAPVKILTASLGNDAGLVGAAMLAKENRER